MFQAVPLPNYFAMLPFALPACLAGVELICLWSPNAVAEDTSDSAR